MSVFIPGVFLPKYTDEAIIVFSDGSVSLMSQDGFEEIRIPFDGIKAVEIQTPHGRLIDADAYHSPEDLNNDPTIIEAEGGGDE